MKILVTGATGLIGSRLVLSLASEGHQVFCLSRNEPENENSVQWDPYEGFQEDEQEKLEGVDAVVHLAGESVATAWTNDKKEAIRRSRVEGTRTLVDALKKLEKPPGVFVSASAIGFYGSRGDELLTEESRGSEGFLPDLCVAWEQESQRAKEFSARVVIPRIGLVLSKDGGALGKMLTPFSFGLGGTVGSGEQWMSWIAIDDLVKLLRFLINNSTIEGAVNATSPNPVTNSEFTAALGKALNRPTIIPVPEFGVKLLFGEMGKRLLLEGARVVPEKLLKSGFEFDFPELGKALRHVLKS